MDKVAWYVETSESADIIFADTEESAELIGCDRLGEDVETVKRSPQYDQYANIGRVPKQVLIDNGWQFECYECQSAIDAENEQEDDDGNKIYPDIVYFGNAIFCCQQCCDDYLEKRLIASEREAKVKELILAEFPNAKITYTYAGRGYKSFAFFNLPGCNCIKWHENEEGSFIGEFSVQQDDFEAFNAQRIKEKQCNIN